MWNFRHFSKNENELYQRVDEVLHYIWDPIGISDIPEARDEYHSYLPVVYGLVKRGATVGEIADYLSSVTSEMMGLGLNRDRDSEVAEILINWKECLFDEDA
jgi:hypothetical protein